MPMEITWRAGRNRPNGNISQDPQFVDATNNDYHLQDVSPCINAGDHSHSSRGRGSSIIMAMPGSMPDAWISGASEYFDNFRPVPEAGPDQLNSGNRVAELVALDGSASSDPNGAGLSYHWSQISGPTVTLSDAGAAKPSFNAFTLGTYIFQLVVSNGSFNSFPDIVQVTVTNAPPIADAGASQVYSEGTASITLDGARSSDPEQMALSYRWTQISGWNVQLSDPQCRQTRFRTPVAGNLRLSTRRQ